MNIRRTLATSSLIGALALSGCASPMSSSPQSTPSSSTEQGNAELTDQANLHFAVEADPHMDDRSDADVFSATLSHINETKPAFLIDLGDIFMVDKLPEKSDAAIRERYELMKGFYDTLDTSIPLYFAMGNHDGEAGWDKLNAHAYREEYFPEQTSQLNYYSFEQGDSLMIVLDPFSYTSRKPNEDGWAWTLGGEQYSWLEQTLASSTAKHKFVFIHHLVGGNDQGRGGSEWAHLFEWGGENQDGTDGFAQNRPGWSMPIRDLLTTYGVDIVFKGHDHFYAHQERDGLTYQTLPQPSHPGSQLNDDPQKFGYTTGTILGGSGFLDVTTRDSGVTVRFIDSSGEQIDSYTVPASR